MPVSVFARLIDRFNQYEGDVIGLQIGDTHLPPPVMARLGALEFSRDDDPELYNYSKAHGDVPLIERLVEKLRMQNGFADVAEDNVQITAGATNALSCAVRGVLDPGEDMLILSPHWPYVRGITTSAGVTPIEVPFGPAEPADLSLGEQLEKYMTPRTGAVYVSTPNNPDGRVLTGAQLAELSEVAERHNLWVISDEVYEELIYDGRQHVSVATTPGLAGRTLTAFSFSKSYGLAGLRVGYLVGPVHAAVAVMKMVHHTIYNVPRAMQRAALNALDHGQKFLAEARPHYQHCRDVAHSLIDAPCEKPPGATYLFLDLRQWSCPEEGCITVLEKIADAGVLLTPGGAFGRTYGDWARMCFVAVPEEKTREGIARINDVLHKLERR